MPPVSLIEAGRLLGCSANTVYSRIFRGVIRGWQDNRGKWWVDLSQPSGLDTTFIPPMTMRRRSYKYFSLCQYLEHLPLDRNSVRLSFAEIEVILQSTLPRSAETTNYWHGGPMVNANWRRSGWDAKRERTGSVLFTRMPKPAAS